MRRLLLLLCALLSLASCAPDFACADAPNKVVFGGTGTSEVFPTGSIVIAGTGGKYGKDTGFTFMPSTGVFTYDRSAVGGKPYLVLDPNAPGGIANTYFRGGAPLFYSSTLGDTRNNGIVYDFRVGSTAVNNFNNGLTVLFGHGDPGPIPAGTLGDYFGVVSNFVTAQNNGDKRFDGGGSFAFNVTGLGTIPINGLIGTIIANGPGMPAGGYGINIGAAKELNGTWTYSGFQFSCANDVQHTTGVIDNILSITGATTVHRSSGSFLADGFSVGNKITTSGFTPGSNNRLSTIATVSDSDITTTEGGLTNVGSGTGRAVVSRFTGNCTSGGELFGSYNKFLTLETPSTAIPDPITYMLGIENNNSGTTIGTALQIAGVFGTGVDLGANSLQFAPGHYMISGGGASMPTFHFRDGFNKQVVLHATEIDQALSEGFVVDASRGTDGSEGTVGSGDVANALTARFTYDNGAHYTTGVRLDAVMTAAPVGVAVPSKWVFSTTDAAGAFAGRVTIDENGISAAGGGSMSFVLPGVATASLGSASVTGKVVRVSDGGALGTPVVADGTNWTCAEAKSQNAHVVTCPPYNAKGNNSADDTAAIQAALTDGGWVIIPPGISGTYLLTDTMDVASNSRVTIQAGAMLKFKTGKAAGKNMLRVSGKTGVLIDGNGILEGNKAGNAAGTDFGVYILDSTNVTVRDITVQNFPGQDATGINGGDGVYIGGSAAGGSTNVTLLGITSTGNVRQGISVVRGSQIKILGSTISHISGTAPGGCLDLEPNATPELLREVTISGNVFNDCNLGISISETGPAQGVAITGNTFRAMRSFSIYQKSTNPATITDNYFYLGGATGGATYGIVMIAAGATLDIPLGSHPGANITGNTFEGNFNASERAAIFCTGCQHTTINDNIFRNLNSNAIAVSETSANYTADHISISNNQFYNVLAAGTVNAGVIEAAGAAGCGGTCSLTNLSIIGNSFHDDRGGSAAQNGIRLENSLLLADIAAFSLYGNICQGLSSRCVFATGDANLYPVARTWLYYATIDFASVSASSEGTAVTVSVPGVTVNDNVTITPRNTTPTSGILARPYVSAPGTVSVRPFNVTTGAIDPPSTTYVIEVSQAS